MKTINALYSIVENYKILDVIDENNIETYKKLQPLSCTLLEIGDLIAFGTLDDGQIILTSDYQPKYKSFISDATQSRVTMARKDKTHNYNLVQINGVNHIQKSLKKPRKIKALEVTNENVKLINLLRGYRGKVKAGDYVFLSGHYGTASKAEFES